MSKWLSHLRLTLHHIGRHKYECGANWTVNLQLAITTTTSKRHCSCCFRRLTMMSLSIFRRAQNYHLISSDQTISGELVGVVGDIWITRYINCSRGDGDNKPEMARSIRVWALFALELYKYSYILSIGTQCDFAWCLQPKHACMYINIYI